MLPDIWRKPWLGPGLFEEMDREFAEAEDMLNRMFRTVRDIAPSSGASADFPYYYGYQITVGPDGRPRIRGFGNVKPAAKGLVEQSEVRQPLVDNVLDEKENTVKITAEMPCVNKEDIKLNVTDQYVAINAERGDKKYHADIPVSVDLDESSAKKKYHADIPVSVDLDESSAKAAYSNGILELKIRLKEVSKPTGKAIKAE